MTEQQTLEAPPTEVQVPCPSCARSMSSIENGWQCLACHPIPVNIPKCKTQICKRPLTRLGEPWNCWICLKCNKHPAEVNKAMAEKQIEQHPHKPFKDHVSYSELDELVATKVAEIMAEQRPDYPPTPAEIQAITEPILQNAEPITEAFGTHDGETKIVDIKVPKPETYLQKAKRLGVATHIPTGGMRKKTEIIADIKNLETDEESIEEAKAFSENAQSPPSEKDEFARGMKASDMMNG